MVNTSQNQQLHQNQSHNQLQINHPYTTNNHTSTSSHAVDCDTNPEYEIEQSQVLQPQQLQVAQAANNESGIGITKRSAEIEKANEQLRAEIVACQRAEAEVRFLQKMTQAISESKDFNSALTIVLHKVCEFTRWKFGEAWIPTLDATMLEYSPAWYANEQKLETFKELSEDYKFLLGSGLPGRVWVSKKPEWIQDVSRESDSSFLRNQIAKEFGFKTAVAIPIINRNLVLAVLVFFMFEACAEDKRLVEIVSTAATQLGSLIQRKQAEKALRSSVATNRALINAIPDLLFRINKEGIFVNYKAAKGENLLLPNNELLGKHLYEILPSEVAQPTMNCVEKALATGEVQIFESQLLVDNYLHHYEFRIVVSAENEVMAIVRDITNRKRALEALQQQEVQLKAILNNIPDSAWLKDSECKFIAVNESMLELCNRINIEDVIGKTDYDIFPLDLAQTCVEHDYEVITSGERKYFEESIVNVDGSIRWLETVKTPIYNEYNQVIGTTGIARDITERKRVEQDIINALAKEKELNELKSRFVAMTSHEFRTPLATILSSAELLEHYSRKWSEEKKLNHIQRIQSSVKHMTELLNDVLLIGKADAGKLEFKPVEIDLAQFCFQLVEEIQITTDTHTVVFHTQADSIPACMDEKILRHIFSNLLSNAIKYSPPGSHVYFELTCQEQTATFQIKDEGIGIPIEDQEKLFTSFHRASNVGTISGTGLGLAIVKKSVDVHGGSIAVASELNIGTTFTVTLPLN